MHSGADFVHSCADFRTAVQTCTQLCAQLCTTGATGRRQREGRGAADMHTAVQTCAQLCRFVHSCTDLDVGVNNDDG